MVVLTEELVLAKTRAESLAAVKNVNLWGSDLTDVSILERLPAVEVLSLSVNKIRSLRDFRHCSQLTELYLRKNEIADIREVMYLQGLKNLTILWLCDNPCVGNSATEYRRKVISLLPNVVKLDNIDVTEEERAAATGSFSDEEKQPTPAPASRPSSSRPPSVPSSAERAGRVKSVPEGASKNVLVAVMALIEELGVEDLRSVRAVCLRRLNALGSSD